MSRFRGLSQTIRHCNYHIFLTPKYRYRAITGEIDDEVNTCTRAFSEHLRCEIIELNARVALWDYVGRIKGSTAIRALNKFRHLKEKSYWGNHFWSRAYSVETTGLDSEMVQYFA